MIDEIHPSDLLRTDRLGKDGMVFDPLIDKINELVEAVNRLEQKQVTMGDIKI